MRKRADRRFAFVLGSLCVTVGLYGAASPGRCHCRAKLRQLGVLSPGGACDVSGDDIGRMPVQAAAGPVIPHRGSRVSMRRGFLDVAQRDPSVETGRERITNHAEYLSRSGAPGGYSRGWWLPVRICPAVSQVQARSVCRSAAAMRGGPVRGAPARRRAAWLTGELAAARTSVSWDGMHHVQPERLVARSGAWRDQ
jgi:hypothetical protein